MKKDSKTGRFVRNENTWREADGLLFCFLNGELLFFTDSSNKALFDGLSVTKMAKGYAAVRVNGREIAVHRHLISAPDGSLVDHINRDKKDNRISNLRIADKSMNAFNCGVRRGNTSGVTGVWYRKDTNRWAAEIKLNGSKKSLGCFKEKAEAVQARHAAEVKYYGYQLEG